MPHVWKNEKEKASSNQQWSWCAQPRFILSLRSGLALLVYIWFSPAALTCSPYAAKIQVTCAIHPPVSQRTPLNNSIRLQMDIQWLDATDVGGEQSESGGKIRCFPDPWLPPCPRPLSHAHYCRKRVIVEGL